MTNKIAFVFPGQGSQYVGMGKELSERYKAAEAVFTTADRRLGIKLSEMCFEGPEEELILTVNTQPAILTTSVALLKIVEEEGIRCDYVAGHSLGEYSALVAAQALDFEDALWLVRQRGTYMQEAVPPGEGTMAALLGIEEEKVRELCAASADYGVVEPANYNSPGQIVIAGSTPAVTKAVELAREYGAKRAMLLSVSGPFHSSLLQPASDKLAAALEQVSLKQASVPVMSNVSAELAAAPHEMRENLIRQVSSAVLWQQSVARLIELGVTTFVEIGPGKVLSGLIKKIDKNVAVLNISDPANLEESLTALKRCS